MFTPPGAHKLDLFLSGWMQLVSLFLSLLVVVIVVAVVIVRHPRRRNTRGG